MIHYIDEFMMSEEKDKYRSSKRRHQDEVAIAKQVKIAKQHHTPIDQPHKFVKHHAMDCGDPGCCLCGNPRRNKMFKNKDRLTQQEKRLFQDTDFIRDRHSNGTKNDED